MKLICFIEHLVALTSSQVRLTSVLGPHWIVRVYGSMWDPENRCGWGASHPPPHFVPFLLWGKCSEYTGMVTTATRWLVLLPLHITSCLAAVYFLFSIELIHIAAPAPLISGPEEFPLKQHNNRPYWQQLLRRQLRNFSSALARLLLPCSFVQLSFLFVSSLSGLDRVGDMLCQGLEATPGFSGTN